MKIDKYLQINLDTGAFHLGEVEAGKIWKPWKPLGYLRAMDRYIVINVSDHMVFAIYEDGKIKTANRVFNLNQVCGEFCTFAEYVDKEEAAFTQEIALIFSELENKHKEFRARTLEYPFNGCSLQEIAEFVKKLEQENKKTIKALNYIKVCDNATQSAAKAIETLKEIEND